jgi:hypothetical protein
MQGFLPRDVHLPGSTGKGLRSLNTRWSLSHGPGSAEARKLQAKLAMDHLERFHDCQAPANLAAALMYIAMDLMTAPNLDLDLARSLMDLADRVILVSSLNSNSSSSSSSSSSNNSSNCHGGKSFSRKASSSCAESTVASFVDKSVGASMTARYCLLLASAMRHILRARLEGKVGNLPVCQQLSEEALQELECCRAACMTQDDADCGGNLDDELTASKFMQGRIQQCLLHECVQVAHLLRARALFGQGYIKVAGAAFHAAATPAATTSAATPAATTQQHFIPATLNLLLVRVARLVDGTSATRGERMCARLGQEREDREEDPSSTNPLEGVSNDASNEEEGASNGVQEELLVPTGSSNPLDPRQRFLVQVGLNGG